MRFLFLLLLLLTSFVYVKDESLRLPEKEKLEKKLAQLDQQEGIQLVVAIIPTTEGKDIQQVAEEYVTKWQVGHRGRGRGMLLLLSEKEGRSTIALGYGLEGSINEQAAQEITATVIDPLLQQKKLTLAVEKGTEALFLQLGVSFSEEEIHAPSFWTMRSFLFLLVIVPLLYVIARLAPSPRYWWLSPLAGFILGLTQSLPLAIALSALGICMVLLSLLLRRVF